MTKSGKAVLVRLILHELAMEIPEVVADVVEQWLDVVDRITEPQRLVEQHKRAAQHEIEIEKRMPRIRPIRPRSSERRITKITRKTDCQALEAIAFATRSPNGCAIPPVKRAIPVIPPGQTHVQTAIHSVGGGVQVDGVKQQNLDQQGSDSKNVDSDMPDFK